jgi:predicted nucleotidyltransferase
VVPPDDGAPEARPPRLSDLVALCRHLNETGTRYVVIGGMAIIQAGFVRATEDIDLLVDVAPDNVAALRQALRSLPDRAVDEMADDDIARYVVVRVADEIVVDLMKAACGVEYAEASRLVNDVSIDGVSIPFASPKLLWRTKQTVRDKDRQDRTFLASLLRPDERR